MKALSIRQPWAWAIIAGHKRIENRSWQTAYRGPLLIHAGGRMSASDLDALRVRALDEGFVMPRAADLKLGGIIGQVALDDMVADSTDRWFAGPYGWILSQLRRCRFRPMRGQLRLFCAD